MVTVSITDRTEPGALENDQAGPAMNSGGVRLIAFYLPQFHPIPENDEWWGAGFTEWRNVVTATPQFAGHYQPHLPADLGFYDLRTPDTREAQAALARQYGVHGFCYYHYWFAGRRVLERPLDEVIASGRPDFPFCVCWANEHWSRNWDGSSKQILLAQQYSERDDLEHIDHLLERFHDPRYIRIDGKPLFLIYRPASLPSIRATAERWRKAAEASGLPGLFLAKIESHDDDRRTPPELGLDAAVEFQPDWPNMPQNARLGPTMFWRVARKLGFGSVRRTHRVYDYAGVAEHMMRRPSPSYLRFGCVTPMWDNAARRRTVHAMILHGSTPENYAKWLHQRVAEAVARPSEHRIVFVNAWNEWAEGCHLEPDLRSGRAYLEATASVLRQAANPAATGGNPRSRNP